MVCQIKVSTQASTLMVIHWKSQVTLINISLMVKTRVSSTPNSPLVYSLSVDLFKVFLQPRHSPLWGNEFYLFSNQLCKG